METITFDGVSFKYPNGSENALTNVSFTVNSGELVLLTGRSGSGKSTLLRLLKRQIAPFGERSGEIRIFGKREEELSERECVSRIGFVAQSTQAQLVSDSVRRELAFVLESLGLSSGEIYRKTAETALYFGIEQLYRRKTASLSGGEKQLINLASVMVSEPSLLLLDEPTAQLDPIAAKKLISSVLRLNRELGLTVVISEHRVDELFSYADRILCLENGRLVTNAKPAQAAADPSVFCGSLPTSVQLFRKLGGSGQPPITAALCRSFLESSLKGAELPAPEKKKTDVKPSISLKNIYFRYDKTAADTLSDLSLSGFPGEVLSVLGGNGAGKTTLLKLIAGVRKPYSGRVIIGEKKAEKRRALKTALLPQSPRELFICSTVYEELAESALAVGTDESEVRSAVISEAERLGISSLLERHPYDLSGGEQQKAAVAKLLLLEPDILLLDEPTKGMDYESKQDTIRLIASLRESGKTVVLATHDTQTAALCSDRCALLFDGAIICADEPHTFFDGLAHFTTPEAQIARGIISGAVTAEDIAEAYAAKK